MADTGNRRFLTAEWRHLLMINYEINPAILQPIVPMGTELDTWQGKTFVSMVGFQFLKTRVLGIQFLFIAILRRSICGSMFAGELAMRYDVASSLYRKSCHVGRSRPSHDGCITKVTSTARWIRGCNSRTLSSHLAALSMVGVKGKSES